MNADCPDGIYCLNIPHLLYSDTIVVLHTIQCTSVSALMLLIEQQEWHLACK